MSLRNIHQNTMVSVSKCHSSVGEIITYNTANLGVAFEYGPISQIQWSHVVRLGVEVVKEL